VRLRHSTVRSWAGLSARVAQCDKGVEGTKKDQKIRKEVATSFREGEERQSKPSARHAVALSGGSTNLHGSLQASPDPNDEHDDLKQTRKALLL
jgi:hypothetical protein